LAYATTAASTAQEFCSWIQAATKFDAAGTKQREGQTEFPKKTFFIRRMLCTLRHIALRSLAVSFILIAWLLETNNESSCFYRKLGKVGNEQIFQLVVDGPESTPTSCGFLI
jgi:hypothetical protein